jgi:hypothetical protein
MEECMIGVEPQVMNEMNQVLLAKFTKTDVETALGQMQPMKYLGPDGFTIGFFSKYMVHGEEGGMWCCSWHSKQ